MEGLIGFHSAFYSNRETFHSNQIVLAFPTGYNKMSVYGSGKSLSFAAGDIMSASESTCLHD
ncbi:hypothetical protein [Eubacterium sp. 14-2]|uniref:hypothetical protein n=1 Tax=Eubacterium sp. 14-2 TaxID=1235790 RepID=UPI0012DDBDC6|nr:hypothetical protein [Eubacterium sp. 14-2]